MKTTKTILTILLVMAFIMSSKLTKAQFPTDTATGKVKYTAVINFPGKTKDSLYDKAKLWVTSTFKSSDNLITFDDVKKDKIVATGSVLVDSLQLPCSGKPYAMNTYINFKFVISFKDGKIRYSLENILLTYINCIFYNVVVTGLEDIKPGANSWTKKMIAEFQSNVYKSVNKTIIKLISDFTKSMNQKEDNGW